MTSERHRCLKERFLAACELEADSRAEYLARACPNDPVLRAQIEALLAHDAAPTNFMRTPPPSSAGETTALLPAGPNGFPERIGRYRIRGLLGEGGMGVVYLAEQENPRRTVALKVLKPGAASSMTLRRFEHEAQALARLQHPGIAQIIEAGLAEGSVPFFAMENIEGRPLLNHARENGLGIRQKLELLVRVCDAVHHAHQKGVIHRDLKPANIMVDESGQPKVLDFGVARLTDGHLQTTSLHTTVGQLVGTLPYMSPEQIGGDPHELDTPSDVYSLGVIAYELLSGRLPYRLERHTVPEAARVIREEDITPLSAVNRCFRGDLETIVNKALEKDKDRRYPSASELAADIRRFLNDEPILARPAGAAYQFCKFARRNKVLVAGVIAVFAALLAGVVGTGWQAIRALEERDKAVLAEKTARQMQHFLENILASVNPEKAAGRDTTILREVLDDAADRIETEMAGHPAAEAQIRAVIGQTYESLGLYASADPHFRKALALQRTLTGGASHEMAALLIHLGALLQDQGDLAGAEPLLREALEIARRLHGDEHADVATAVDRLAMLMHRKGDLASAESLYRQALDMRRKLLGDEDSNVAHSLTNLGCLLMEKRDLTAAELPLRTALDIRRKLVGEEHLDTLTAMNNLAGLHCERGQPAAAVPMLRRVLDLRERLQGKDHPHTAEALDNLGATLWAAGDSAAGEPMIREALDRRRRILGETHPEVALSLNNLAEWLKSKGDYASAEPLLREALDIRRKALGNRHPETAEALGNLAGLLRRKGDVQSAEPLVREALEIWRGLFGDEHVRVAQALGTLGDLLSEQGNFAKAEPLVQQSLAMRRKLLGDEHADVALSLNNLGELFKRKGDYAAAEAPLREALDMRRRLLGGEHRDVAQSLSNLAGLFYAKGDHVTGEPLLREALTLERKLFGDEHPKVATSLNNLALLLHGLGDDAAAEPLHREALALRRKLLGDEHPDVTMSLNNLAMLLIDRGDFDAAEPLVTEALELSRRLRPASRYFADSLVLQGRILMGRNDFPGAEPLFRECLEIRRDEAPDGHWTLANAESILGGCLAAMGRNDEAEPLLFGGALQLEASVGPEHPKTLEAHQRLFEWHFTRGELDQAAACGAFPEFPPDSSMVVARAR